jgi:hypothetical protein
MKRIFDEENVRLALAPAIVPTSKDILRTPIGTVRSNSFSSRYRRCWNNTVGQTALAPATEGVGTIP